MVSLKSSSSVEFKIQNIFLNFVFFEKLSSLKILCEHRTSGMTLFTFGIIFDQIKIFSVKLLIQDYISCY